MRYDPVQCLRIGALETLKQPGVEIEKNETNDRGQLIIAKLSAKGYQEISRTRLIKPTTNPGNRRELGAVNWSHPAYANRHIVARNDEEIISVSLEK